MGCDIVHLVITFNYQYITVTVAVAGCVVDGCVESLWRWCRVLCMSSCWWCTPADTQLLTLAHVIVTCILYCQSARPWLHCHPFITSTAYIVHSSQVLGLCINTISWNL